MRTWSNVTVLLACAVLLPAGASGQTIRGRVLDASDGRPVSAARVSVLAAEGVAVLASATAAEATFEFILPEAGTYRLRVEHVNYATVTSERVTMAAHQVVTVELHLDRDVIALDPLRVVAERFEPIIMADVRRRQRLGFGRFILRDELDERFSSRLEDVLRLPGGLVISYAQMPTGSADTILVPVVTGRQAGLRQCFASVFVNGHPVFTGEQIDHSLQPVPGSDDPRRPEALERLLELFAQAPDQFEAIEIYRGAGQVPAEFSGSASECGVVALWRRGGFNEWRAELQLPPAPPLRLRIGMSGVSYVLSGFHSPAAGAGGEAAAWLVATPRVSAAGLLHLGRYTLSAHTTSYLTASGSGSPNDAGARAMTLLAAGIEPRWTVAAIGPARPALTARGLLAYRSFSAPPAVVGESRTHRSGGWGGGVGAAVEVDLSRRLTAEMAYGREWLRFGGYRTLDQWWRQTSSEWTAAALRAGLSARF